VPLFTNGFEELKLGEKFDKHVTNQNEFPHITTEDEYLDAADSFCGGAMDANTEEHIRSYDSARIRYNRVTNEFGIVGADGYIKTYYKPSAGERYFRRQCK